MVYVPAVTALRRINVELLSCVRGKEAGRSVVWKQATISIHYLNATSRRSHCLQERRSLRLRLDLGRLDGWNAISFVIRQPCGQARTRGKRTLQDWWSCEQT